MPKWKTNDYFSPKTWGRIQEEKRDEELAKVSASPLPMIALAALLFIGAAAGIVFVLASVLR